MKRSTKIAKRLLALFLVVLMSINTLGAVVSDNDGSAFITKAEFDSLKNDFQSQIDQYNTSIDAKIDGAIAAYLAGIQVSKTTTLSFIGGIKHFKDINDFESENARIDTWHGIGVVDMKTSVDANWMAGYEGTAIITTPGTTGKGVFGEAVTSDGKELLIAGFGTFVDKITTTVIGSTSDRGPLPGISGRVSNWALSWAIPGNSDVTVAAYYDVLVRKDETSISMYPRAWAVDSVNTGWSSVGAFGRSPARYAHERIVTYNDDLIGYIINDQAITTLYDKEQINGVETKRDNTFNSTIQGNMKFINTDFSTRTFINNDNNPVWREWSYLKGEGDTDWVLIGNESANQYIQMQRTVDRWNASPIDTISRFDGHNTEAYAANVNNPTRIWTDKYSNDVWNDWAMDNLTADAIKLRNRIYLWNLRYGNLLVAENVKDKATYTLDVTNNGTSDCYIKFFTGIQSKNFDSVNGINTTKSDASNNNAVKLQPSETVNIKFEVNNSDPVFFKCSDGAEITFGDNFIKEE